eukprot:scaffold14204_cov87-Cyclotella_meneghiniana.AAC.2
MATNEDIESQSAPNKVPASNKQFIVLALIAICRGGTTPFSLLVALRPCAKNSILSSTRLSKVLFE